MECWLNYVRIKSEIVANVADRIEFDYNVSAFSFLRESRSTASVHRSQAGVSRSVLFQGTFS